MRNARLDEAQAGIRIARRNINDLKYADDIPPYGRKWRKTKEPLESEIVGLKLISQKTKIMASGPITSWQIDGEQWKQWQTLYFGGSKITADGDYNHEIKRCLLLGRNVMTNLGSMLRSRDMTLPTKSRLFEALVFPVVMYGCESWTIKKAEQQTIDAFELWCWRRLLRVPWTARIFIQSILKVISPECSLEGLMLKLKFQYFGHLTLRTDSSEKTQMLRKIEGRRRRGRQRMAWLDVIKDLMDMSFTEVHELLMHREAWCAEVYGLQRVAWVTELKATIGLIPGEKRELRCKP